MSHLISSTCAQCGQEFKLGAKVVPVWVITHKGRVHTEADPTQQMAHIKCPLRPPGL